MHELSSIWLRRKKGEGIRPNTVDDYEWQLGHHLLPFFGRLRPSQVNDARVEEYIDLKIAEREEVLDAQAAGVVLRDASGRPRRTLANRTIIAQLVTLAAILDVAVRRGWLARNPARGHRLKTRNETGSVLEGDEVWSLIVAAGELDRTVNSPQTLDRSGEVRRLRDTKKMPWKEIAKTLGCAESTAIYYYAQREGRAPTYRLVRRALVATLAGAGLRVTEAAELNCEDIDIAHRKLRIRDAKTEAGVREVHLSPWLVEELSDYLASLPAPPRGADPAFPTRRGGRGTRTTSETESYDPRSPRPTRCAPDRNTSRSLSGSQPHTLRRTYASLLLTANAEPQRVMAQLGHTDPSMTLRLYAQVLRRRDSIKTGEAFDRLISGALPEDGPVPSSPPSKMSDRTGDPAVPPPAVEGSEHRG
jgi:integrase